MKAEAVRFWSKADLSAGPEGCWPWMGTHDSHGYGLFRVDGRWTRATRTALRLDGRPVPVGQFGLHHCDNPPCVNPAHLWTGSKADNTLDAYRKGRLGLIRPLGEAHPSAKLTAAKVVEIRLRHSAGATFAALAKDYGVSAQSISALVARRHWKHVA